MPTPTRALPVIAAAALAVFAFAAPASAQTFKARS